MFRRLHAGRTSTSTGSHAGVPRSTQVGIPRERPRAGLMDTAPALAAGLANTVPQSVSCLRTSIHALGRHADRARKRHRLRVPGPGHRVPGPGHRMPGPGHRMPASSPTSKAGAPAWPRLRKSGSTDPRGRAPVGTAGVGAGPKSDQGDGRALPQSRRTTVPVALHRGAANEISGAGGVRRHVRGIDAAMRHAPTCRDVAFAGPYEWGVTIDDACHSTTPRCTGLSFPPIEWRYVRRSGVDGRP
ncbi:hypothetical protein DWB77_00165 [Streptomyces hundungensis]|uniref:Uncharacterized protein n=1 Tax=Streptomyces hundungensis TaxID=1077946 RepID=A0A387HBP9_9ACTN|nr:hypothetical protein DWB77_00165 [Streptomyces hundungensis]